jgi:hypothetical protein
LLVSVAGDGSMWDDALMTSDATTPSAYASDNRWALIRQFGLTCHAVVDVRKKQPAGVAEAMTNSICDNVVLGDRFGVFLAEGFDKDSRRVELRRLIDIGVTLLSMEADSRGLVAGDDLTGIFTPSAMSDIVARVEPTRQLQAYVLTFVYPVEWVLSLTGAEILLLVGLVEGARRIIPVSVMTNVLVAGVDGELAKALLG